MASAKLPYPGPVVSRDDARASGLKRYFTGEPCSSGHLAERKTVNCRCLECHREKQAQWYKTPDYRATYLTWAAANRERLLAKGAAYRDANRDKIMAYNAAYRQANRDRIAAYNLAAYLANREVFLARCAASRAKRPGYHKDWCARNKPAVAAHRHRRRARRKAAGGSFTGADVAFLLAKQRWRCVYCRTGLRRGYHVDHRVPLAGGGSNDKSNIQVLCPRCNTRKRATDPIEFAQRLGLLL